MKQQNNIATKQYGSAQAIAVSIDLSKIILLVSCLALTALGAQVRIPLWFTPVPLTGQVFGVLCTGLLLAPRSAALVQAAYIGLGVLGLPWFTAGGSGAGYLFGLTGGYLLGFILSAFVVASLRSRAPRLLAALGGVACIYILGTIWFSLYLSSTAHMPLAAALSRAVMLGIAPFVSVDILKVMLAVGTTWLISPRSGSRGRTR